MECTSQVSQEQQVHALVDRVLESRSVALSKGECLAGFSAKQGNKSRLICGDCDCGMAGCNS